MITSSQEHDDTSGGTQTSRVANCYEYHGALGRQDQQLGDSSGDERRVKYDYDANGRLTGLNWPYMRGEWGGDHVDYSDFDGLGRPKTIQNCIGGSYTHLVTYTFLGGRVAVKDYPQSPSSYTVRQTFWSSGENNYDPYGRLLRSHAVRDPDGTPVAVMDLNYLYDDGGNPTWRYDALQNSGTTSWSQAYQYDVQNRLTQAGQGPMNGTWPSAPAMSAPVKTWIWDDGAIHTMDALGNFNNYFNGVTDDMRTHNVANQITQRYGVAMSYDDNGNLINNSLTFKAVYDFRNRLVQMTRQDDTLQAAYSYDGLNRRIRKTTYDTDGTTVLSDVRYIYDGEWRVIEERDLTNYNQLVARYVYGTQYVDELVRTYRDFDADGEFTGTNETLCYLQDRLFNVVALTDVYGAVQERVFYEPYGRSTCHRISDDDETVGSHFGNPYLFTGRELDSETCFYNYRARYYSPMLCRFLNRDPIGYEGGINLYEYVGDNPIVNVDPSGEQNRLYFGVGNGTPQLPLPSWVPKKYCQCVCGYFWPKEKWVEVPADGNCNTACGNLSWLPWRCAFNGYVTWRRPGTLPTPPSGWPIKWPTHRKGKGPTAIPDPLPGFDWDENTIGAFYAACEQVNCTASTCQECVEEAYNTHIGLCKDLKTLYEQVVCMNAAHFALVGWLAICTGSAP